MNTQDTTRRNFLAGAAAAAVSLATASSRATDAETSADSGESDRPEMPPLGLPTYMFKHYDLDQTIAMARRVAVKHICIRSNLMAMDSSEEQIKQTIAKVTAAGLIPYGGGVIYMRDEQQLNRAFEYSQAAGFTLISINILPSLLPLLEKKVKQFDIRAAIHNHGPEDRHWPTPQAVYDKIRRLDKRIGICHDTGHTQRAGVDPIEATLTTGDRIYDLHLKDVDAATGKGHSTELGRGVVDIPGILRAVRRIGYRDVVGIEYEKQMEDLLPGLAESVGYTRGVFAALERA